MEQASTPATPVRYVGFWARFLAFLIDSLLAAFILSPVIGIFFDSAEPDFQTMMASPEVMVGAMFSGANLVNWLLCAAAVIVFWFYKSATPGKMAINAIIVDADTLGKPSGRQLIGRYLAYYVSMMPMMLGFLWVAFDARKQGWHDKLAGTVVIKKK